MKQQELFPNATPKTPDERRRELLKGFCEWIMNPNVRFAHTNEVDGGAYFTPEVWVDVYLAGCSRKQFEEEETTP